MYELSKYFITKQREGSTEPASVTEDTVIQFLDNAFSEWAFKITQVTSINNKPLIVGTLLFPGHSIDGTGTNEYEIMCNIINKTFNNTQTKTIKKETKTKTSSEESSDGSKMNAKEAIDRIAELKAKSQETASEEPTEATENKANNNDDVFSQFMNNEPKKEPAEEKEEEPEVLEFFSEEAEKKEEEWQEFLEEKQNEPKTLTPEEVNPENRPMGDDWDTNNGKLIRQWMKENNVNSEEQLSSWLRRFCGLEYAYFNPVFTQQFILWTKALREQQTY